ncbi:helicase associated domain-containing protein [Streptomyces sp. NPDC059928]|uniref:helicase associated domain-containing protein n=1 Tax=unclassified Streptomyces TaxID=2593676 RepID=UPI003668990A
MRNVGLKALLDAGALLTGIAPGVTWRGDDIRRWFTRQQRDFHRLNPEQQKRLAQLGVEAATTPARRPAPSGTRTGTATACAGRGEEAFPRGLAALAQYIEREQRTVIPRQHAERITIEGHEHDVHLKIWLSNQKSRRDKPDGEQRAQLSVWGVDWP